MLKKKINNFIGFLVLLGLSLWILGLAVFAERALDSFPSSSSINLSAALIRAVTAAPGSPPEAASAESPNLPVEQISLSRHALKQAETLTITVAGAHPADQITGRFRGQKIGFFPLGQNLIAAFLGIDVKTPPDSYPLEVFLPNQTIEKKIIVTGENYPVTRLVVTEKLKEKGFTAETISVGLAQKDNPDIYEAMTAFTPRADFHAPFAPPLSSVTVVGAYGNIRVDGKTSIQHLGVDLEAPVGTPVLAVQNGTVVFARELPNYGKTLIIDHGLGIFSLYLHLDEFLKTPGSPVQRGETIARSGQSGYSLEPHLHFSLRANGVSIDPLKFIAASQKLEF